MAASGFTPISLYYSSTTTNQPTNTNLVNGELAINITDGKLFYKDNTNTVQVIGWKTVPATAGGTGITAAGTTGNVLTSNGTAWVSSPPAASMTYPSAGIANSTGSAWGTSYTTTGSGTVVALATTPSLTNPTVTNYVETLYAPAAGSAFTVDLANGTVQKLSLNANGTITLPSSVSGKSFVIIVTYSGAYTLTWAGGSTIKWPSGTAPTASSASGKFDIFTFFCDGTNTYGNSFGLNY